ncbi:hypothetical protein NPIL_43721 [Nephila pilipes]|uniref:Uncharacterized protein n=1 Tax=Nephila pilipes TaxID=299642 RepID=A0A8X6NYQ0_NEPPI|nr:hypothetical protein NPIL_43721 [Nephila pilipes]
MLSSKKSDKFTCSYYYKIGILPTSVANSSARTRANGEQSESQWQTGGVIKRHPRRVWLTAASGTRSTGNPIPFLQRSFGMDNGLQKGGHEEYSISERANCSPGKSVFRTKEKEIKRKKNFWEPGRECQLRTNIMLHIVSSYHFPAESAKGRVDTPNRKTFEKIGSVTLSKSTRLSHCSIGIGC